MTCSDCGYSLRPGHSECPRCRYRQAIQQEVHSAVPPTVDPAEPPSPAEADPPRRGKLAVTLVVAACLLVAACFLMRTPLRAYRQAQAVATLEARAADIFARADGPCRSGEDAPCRQSIAALNAMRDHSDASLLLGDLRVAHYLRDRPGGGDLPERWRHNQLSAAELTSLGNEAINRGSIVFRSFWLYANVVRNHVAVPTLTINPGPMKNPWRR